MADHHRRSIRLPGYDYSQPGEYFITMVVFGRKSIFGVIDGDRVRLSPYGQIAREQWLKTPTLRPEIELGEFVVMPNHFHGIIRINVDADVCRGTIDKPLGSYGDQINQPVGAYGDPIDQPIGAYGNPIDQPVGVYGDPIDQPVGAYGHTPLQDDALIKTPLHSPSRTIGALVRGYKGMVTKRINELRGTPSTPVWQRNYYEEIITTDDSYLNIAAYIESNPANWTTDKENVGSEG